MYDAVGAQLSTRHRLVRALPRAVKDGIAPYFVLRPKPAPGLRAAAAHDLSWTVADLCAAYSWPKDLKGDAVIAIIELDGGWVQSDVDAYFEQAKLPKPKIVDVSIGAARNNPNQHVGDPRDPDVEVTLDILIAAASYSIATGKPANIRVYWASNTDWGAMAGAVTAATADGCDVCSISWGSDESNWKSASDHVGVDYIAQFNRASQAAAKGGMIVFGAAGDNDSSDGGPSPTNVDLPSSCPFVTGCGGTRKERGSAETVWNTAPGQADGEGTGGGFSRIFTPMPAWESNAPHGRGRMVPDVAANADSDTGYKIVVHGSDAVVGGTSAVAPLYAGLFAAFGRKLGFVNPKLWANQTAFTDITTGDNGFYRAAPGPDPCTGLGVPIGDQLAKVFNAPKGSEVATALVSAPHAAETVHTRKARRRAGAKR